MSQEILERRYRRLLACYPYAYRAAYGEEMLAVALSAARPGALARSRRGGRPDLHRPSPRARLGAAGFARSSLARRRRHRRGHRTDRDGRVRGNAEPRSRPLAVPPHGIIR